MSKQAEIQQAEWIVKTYNDYEKDVCRNDTVNIWVYEQKLKLIEEIQSSKRFRFIWSEKQVISFFLKFYLVCGLIYTTVNYNDDMRNMRTMMRGRPSDTIKK